MVLIYFKLGSELSVFSCSEVDDIVYWLIWGWVMFGGDVFEDVNCLVVKLEVLGMEKQDFDIEVIGDMLVVIGEKKFECESSEGCW